MDTSSGSRCATCPHNMLDPLGHHAVTCIFGGDVVSRQNQLRVPVCGHAVLQVSVLVLKLRHEHLHTRPADVLLPNWVCSKPAALDFTGVSPLGSTHIVEAGTTAGSAVLSAEERKHAKNDQKCTELNWVCAPMAVVVYGAWGDEAQGTFSRLATRLSVKSSVPKPEALSSIYVRLNMILVRVNARALLSRVTLG